MRILSRASDLARLQAQIVGHALRDRWPDLDTVLLTRSSAGDRDVTTPLVAMPDKGAFTADLSDALLSNDADIVVHSWKDLPLESGRATVVAGTLERADPRDLLLVRREVIAARPTRLRVLSSSPRRAWLLGRALPRLLPWPVDDVSFVVVRGNIPTRLRRLLAGEGDALVVAKAAIDRLLEHPADVPDVVATIRQTLGETQWMVLPLRDVPGAPAQGALAIETAAANSGVQMLVDRISHKPTWQAVQMERAVLAAHGGGCHEALGATVLARPYGHVVSIKAHTSSGSREDDWSLRAPLPSPPRVPASQVWPRPDERAGAARRPSHAADGRCGCGVLAPRGAEFMAREDVAAHPLVWASSSACWQQLAQQGLWVHGCADGLGEDESPHVTALTGHELVWWPLGSTAGPSAGARDEAMPADLPARSHFFWSDPGPFVEALMRWPALASAWHACAPGRMAEVLRERLPRAEQRRVWLDYEDWRREVVHS